MITVLGASGFVGSHLVSLLKKRNMAFQAPARNAGLHDLKMGHVIYCIGMTADFRTKPFQTIDAHVSKLKDVLENCTFESLTYLSSTRLYLKTESLHPLKESDNIVLNGSDASDIFAASKITGELLALNCGKPHIKVVRLSNVFGDDFESVNFITSIVKDALLKGKVELLTSPDSEKDYISIEDTCEALLGLCEVRNSGIYNLAFGENVTNAAIVNELAKQTGAAIEYARDAKKVIFTQIDNSKLTDEIGFRPAKNITRSIGEIVSAMKAKLFQD